MISKSLLRNLILGTAFILLPAVLLTPRSARADRDGRERPEERKEERKEERRDDRWEDRRREEEEMRRREEERHRWEREHPVHHEILAPAPVVYMPPPPSPGISIVLPIKIF